MPSKQHVFVKTTSFPVAKESLLLCDVTPTAGLKMERSYRHGMERYTVRYLGILGAFLNSLPLEQYRHQVSIPIQGPLLEHTQ